MRVANGLTDDEGTKWEFRYEEKPYREEHDPPGALRTRVEGFRYRKNGDTVWLTLPPWADVAEPWKINLCMFTEDEETEELTFWEVTSDATS